MRTKTKLPIENLEQILKSDWPNLHSAREKTVSIHRELSKKLSNYSNDDSSIVVFGSLARREFTEGSDIDWTLLIDGRAQSSHYRVKHEIAQIINQVANKDVGEEGTFGNMAFSHDILHRIGGDDDTNKNTTQRILLLLESASIGNDDALSRVMKEVLRRYITEDWGVFNKIDIIPRFLLNDIVRYWRTMCVDFAYKRRKGQGTGWAVRTIKLRLSRKLIYVSGLLACFSFELNHELKHTIENTERIKKRQDIMVNHLHSLMRLTPLDILAKTAVENVSLSKPIKQIIDNYDEFLSILSNTDLRKKFDKLTPEETNTDEDYKMVRKIGHSFQSGLNKLFLQNNGTDLFKLTKKYGVF